MDKWEEEPDEKKFVCHGLQCEIKRHPSFGHLCGYVAVDKNHPWYGKTYSDQVKVPQSIIDREVNIDKVGAINLLCASHKTDAMKDGYLDIVLAIDVHGGLTYSQGRDDKWWFGFDCAHAGDLSPYMREFGTYRDMEYVTVECENLAKQLAAIQVTKTT